MKATFNLFLIFLITTVPVTMLQAQQLTDIEMEKIRSEIDTANQAEQKAFVDGDCDRVISFFDENVTFYANGRIAPSLGFIQGFCRQIPRPFVGGEPISDKIYIHSDRVAHHVKIIEFVPENSDSDSFRREVVTKVWSKQTDGWKIVHFHSSVSAVPKM